MLAACAATLVTPSVQITAIPTINAPHRGPVLVQYCADDTWSYPRGDFQSANKLVATSLPAAVVANADGLTLYATLITSNTVDPSNTLAPFIIPVTSPYPALPTPLPTESQANPVSYSSTATAIANQQGGDIATYNTQMANVNGQLETTRAQVAKDAQRLISWNPSVDATATSVWGCLQLARERFAGHSGTKYLIIASDMQNNTNVDYTEDFESSQALKGVAVHVIYYVCQTAGTCESLAASWKNVFTASGASAVQFDDPAQSQAITNLFGGN
jgi:hypothetical protein